MHALIEKPKKKMLKDKSKCYTKYYIRITLNTLNTIVATHLLKLRLKYIEL